MSICYLEEKKCEDIKPALEIKKLIMLVKKLLPDVVFNIRNAWNYLFDIVIKNTDSINVDIFKSELPIIIGRCKSKTELAFEIFLWGALNQFYYDGNKRTSRMISNIILIKNGQGIFNIKAKDRLKFNTLMVEFYNTREADNIVDFFNEKCLERY